MMYFIPIQQRMKEFFYKSSVFFQTAPEKAQRRQQPPPEQREKRGVPLREPAPGLPQRQQIGEAAQQHTEKHEQPQLTPAGDAAQQKEQHRSQQGIGQIEESQQPLQPEAAHERRLPIVEKAQHSAAGQTEQRLKALKTGIDAHQPMRRPRKPRRSFSPA